MFDVTATGLPVAATNEVGDDEEEGAIVVAILTFGNNSEGELIRRKE